MTTTGAQYSLLNECKYYNIRIKTERERLTERATHLIHRDRTDFVAMVFSSLSREIINIKLWPISRERDIYYYIFSIFVFIVLNCAEASSQ